MRQYIIRFTSTLYFLFTLGNLLSAQDSSNYYFNHINGENGLSASNVKAILQDSYGFMWFGTKNGLNRYDGTSILQFNCKDLKTGIGNNNIGALFEDKNHKLWVGTDRGIYIYDSDEDTFSLVQNQSPDGFTPDNWIAEILSDKKDHIWALVPDQGIFCFRGDEMEYYSITNKDNFKSENPSCMCISEQGELWVGTGNGALFKYKEEKNTFEQQLGNTETLPVGKSIESMCFQAENLILAIHGGELMRFNTRTLVLTKIPFAGEKKTFLRDVMCFGNQIWVGTHHGLFIIDEEKHTEVHLKEDLMRASSLSDNIIYTIYTDPQGIIWIGTMFGGVDYLPDYLFRFDKYVPGSDGHSLNTKRIRGMTEDNYGNIWIGTEDNGINVLNIQSGKIHQVKGSNADNPISLCMEHYDNYIYCGLFKQGMDIFSTPGEQLQNISDKDLNIEEGSVYSFLIDSNGRRWVGTGWGLHVTKPHETVYNRVDVVGYNWVFDILEASDGTIWFAIMGSGVWKYNPETASFRHYPYEGSGLGSNSVSSITEDSKANLWFSTDRGGISRYNKAEDRFDTFTIEDGLPDDVTYDILEDDSGYLWFGTNKGLVKFHPETHEIRVFTTKDGLLGNQFSYKSALKAQDGRFYFGGVNGLIAFEPNMIEKERSPSPLYISKLSIYNEEITVHTPNSPLKKSIIHTDKIELPYNQANISFDVALLSYGTSSANQYYYRMEPLDKDWIKAASNKNLSYAKLSPGKYTFQVKATHGNQGDEASYRTLSIIILPPWWLSSWAYMLYFAGIAGLIYCCFVWYTRHKERQMEEKQKLFEIGKEKELYEAKVDFFTEIAHEIRTPLTLINGPLEAIKEMPVEKVKMSKYLHVVEQNTQRLLELTSQLLDFQKVGANKLSMKFESVDITTLLKGVIARFEVAIALNKKELLLNVTEESVWAAVDKEGITKILSNLLNNALKYARQTILVELEKDNVNFIIRVISDGNKILADMSQQIFEPFYQSEKKDESRGGVGIGLSLARSLALLHKGTLELDASQAENIFVLTVPLNKEGIEQENDKAIQKEIVVMEDASSITTDMHGYRLLFVEDNENMLNFILERLQEYFTVEVAKNGKEALDILDSIHIDLIISDIMMPVMNGYELCERVKSDINLSHIPIIFLTAKNDLDSKINGLKYGAEAYVEKPFSFNYLKEQVFSILENRRRERETFSKRPFFSVNNMQMNKADEEFMNKIIKIIEANITDVNFGVERMAEHLSMSRSNLLRKIKTLFNLSPLDFIRLIKLKKAAEFILEGKYRIGDVCYMVGINSPSYFSKLFQKQFGMSPKDFEKQSQSGKQYIITQEIEVKNTEQE